MLEERLKEVYERYNWLRAKLRMKYNIYWDYAITLEDIYELNAWHEKMEKYLAKRFVREFSKVVASAMDKAEEVTV